MNLPTYFIALSLLATLAEADDHVIADFEANTYGKWKVEGEAFGNGPAKGGLDGQMGVSGFQGKGFVNSYHGRDGSTGKLTSPEFEIVRPHISFLIGGGGHSDRTCINLLIDGEVVRSATGSNVDSGGDERLEWTSWDVKALIGKKANLQIIDAHTGGWGHINIDQIVQSDKARGAVDAVYAFTAAQRYLYLPVETGGKKRRLKLKLGEKIVRELDVELATGNQVSLTSALDIAKWRGEELTLVLGKIDPDSAVITFKQSDELPNADTIYGEKYRPLFHFTSKIGWLNDPNGMVYDQGEWHLYYQHNPYGWNWGNMHWGHAVSADLVHWKEIGDAIFPWSDCKGAAFSGSATIDHNNTSGWGAGVMVAALTDTGAGESMAYSTDKGRTFTMFEGNPVVKHESRDPKIIWHEPSKNWVMALYSVINKVNCVAFYNSPDLKKWEYQSHLENYFECTDLFELPVDGDKDNTRWIVYAANADYAVGQFDGKVFTPEHEGKHKLWHGNYYAAQTYDNAPDGRRVQIGWGRGVIFPGMPFNQQMSVPAELTLHQTAAGIRMRANPVKELDRLHQGSVSLPDLAISDATEVLKFSGEGIDLSLRITPTDAKVVGLDIRGAAVSYDVEKNSLKVGKLNVPISLQEGSLDLRFLVDRGSLELFINGGETALQVAHLFDLQNQAISVFAKQGAANFSEISAHQMRSSWK